MKVIDEDTGTVLEEYRPESEYMTEQAIENIKNLAKLIAENPNMPVIPMVEQEVIGDDQAKRWAGHIGTSEVKEFILRENIEGTFFYYRKDQENLIDMIAENSEEEDYSVAQQEAREKVNAMQWNKAIFLNVDM